ncbi:hypothetical protein K525DRAFT_368206 [Schizophyllum commune Loenen D]|nr:hypothetical protein K525DRAFT_368206 [Schizophyllum commune Loenen D]
MPPSSSSRRPNAGPRRDTRERSKSTAQRAAATTVTGGTQRPRVAQQRVADSHASTNIRVGRAGSKRPSQETSRGPPSKRLRTNSTTGAHAVNCRADAARAQRDRPVSRRRVPLGSQDINLNSDDEDDSNRDDIDRTQPPKHRRQATRVRADEEEDEYDAPRADVDDEGPEDGGDDGVEDGDQEPEVDTQQEVPHFEDEVSEQPEGHDPSRLFDSEAEEGSRGRPHRPRGRRDAQRLAEEPVINDDPPHQPSQSTPSLHPTSQTVIHFPDYTNIVGSTRELAVLRQSIELRTVLAATEENIKYDILFRVAFHSDTTIMAYIRDAIIKAAEANHYPAIADRVRHDPAYFHALRRHLKTRMATFRRPWKVVAENQVASSYGLKRIPKGELSARISHMLKTFSFINDTKEDGSPDKGKAFLHPCVIAVLEHALFSSKRDRSVGRFIEKFPKYNGMVQVPAPTVALAATAIFVALHQWGSPSGQYSAKDFATKFCLGAYKGLLGVLDNIKAANLTKYNHLLAHLYERSSENMETGYDIEVEDIMGMVDIDAMEG